jgi:hypothetical protein
MLEWYTLRKSVLFSFGFRSKSVQNVTFSSTNHDLFLKKEHFWFEKKNIFSTITVLDLSFFFRVFVLRVYILLFFIKKFVAIQNICTVRNHLVKTFVRFQNFRSDFFFHCQVDCQKHPSSVVENGFYYFSFNSKVFFNTPSKTNLTGRAPKHL